MDKKTWWKNFALQSELEIAGAFIYNGLRTLHSAPSFGSETTSFEILYNLSVGIERLQKVAIVLLESERWDDLARIEESLKGHNTHALADRIEMSQQQGLAPIHKEFLGVLSDFYKNHRYGRFSLSSASAMGAEHKALVAFFIKHLPIDPPAVPDLIALQNTDQIRRFMGKVLKRIVGPLYEVIRAQAGQAGLFTYELSSDSKAGRIFLCDRLDFVDEGFIRREILLHLLQPDSDSLHLKNIRGFSPLKLDSGLDVEFIAYLLDETPAGFAQVGGEVEAAFEDLGNVDERLEVLRLLDQEVHWDGPSCDLLPSLQERFGRWLDRGIVGIRLILEPDEATLEVTRRLPGQDQISTQRDSIPLAELSVPMNPDEDDLERTANMLQECDAYTWLMISDIFDRDAHAEIATDAETAGTRARGE